MPPIRHDTPKKPASSFNVRLSGKAVAAISAYAEAHELAPTRVLTDLIELQVAGTKPAWFGSGETASLSPDAVLEDRLAGVLRATIDAGLDRHLTHLRSTLISDMLNALRWSIEGSDARTPDWAMPFAGQVGDVIAKAFVSLLRAELERPESKFALRATNTLAVRASVHSAAALEIATAAYRDAQAAKGGTSGDQMATAIGAFVAEAKRAEARRIVGFASDRDALIGLLNEGQPVQRDGRRRDRALAEKHYGDLARKAWKLIQDRGRLYRWDGTRAGLVTLIGKNMDEIEDRYDRSFDVNLLHEYGLPQDMEDAVDALVASRNATNTPSRSGD